MSWWRRSHSRAGLDESDADTAQTHRDAIAVVIEEFVAEARGHAARVEALAAALVRANRQGRSSGPLTP